MTNSNQYNFNVNKVVNELTEHLAVNTPLLIAFLQSKDIVIDTNISISDLSVLAYEITAKEMESVPFSNPLFELTVNELLIVNRLVNNLFSCEVLLSEIKAKEIKQEDAIDGYITCILESPSFAQVAVHEVG